MHGDVPFRVALVAVILVTVSVMVPFRRKAASSGERITYQEEGYLFAATLRFAGLLLWVSTLASQHFSNG